MSAGETMAPPHRPINPTVGSSWRGRSTNARVSCTATRSACSSGGRRSSRSTESTIRQSDASFLLYALLDSIVDRYYPLLERYSDRLSDINEELLERPTRATLQRIHSIKRELLLLRRAAWPVREVIAKLQRDKHERRPRRTSATSTTTVSRSVT